MTRKEFLAQAGAGAALLLIPACIGGLSGCKKKNSSSSSGVDFTIDVSSGPLAANGGSLVQNGVIVARTNSGTFIAVASACTHEGSTVQYVSSGNSFYCPNHGARFSSTGAVTQGPATTALKQYNTELNGSSLHVFS